MSALTSPISTAGTAAGAAGQSAPAAATDTKTVNISLPAHIHNYFSKQAAADDRTITNLLVRKLKAIYDEETSPAAAGE